MKKYFLLLLLLILLLIPLMDLTHPGLPITHDGKDHVARIANFYQNLEIGNPVPRWAENLDWGYGHPILMFLYPFSSYMASFFHVIGFNFVDSTKLVFGISFVLSGLTMFLWLRLFLSEKAAFFGALLYTFAPYRFVDLYVRGAIGEHVAFIFPPLVLYFLYRLAKNGSYKNIFGIGFSLAGLILAHNAISLLFLPIILLYICILTWQKKQKKKTFVLSATIGLALGFLLSAFFWMPAFMEGKYTLRDIVTGKEALTRFVPWERFLYGEWSYGITGQFTVQFGIIHWLVFIFSFFVAWYLYKKKDKNWALVAGFLFAFIITGWMMTESSRPVWEVITTLQKFQFPWRFLSLSVFLSAVLGAFALSIFSQKKQTILLVIGVVALLWINKDYWHANGYLNKPEIFYTGIYNSTTDTGESAPIWSVRFMLKQPKNHLDVLSGKAHITEITRTPTTHVYEITADEKTRLRENTLYFPGWKIFVDGNPVDIQFQDRANHGIMTFWIEKGKHTVTISFQETKLRLLANGISIVTLLFMGSFAIWKGRKWQK